MSDDTITGADLASAMSPDTGSSGEGSASPVNGSTIEGTATTAPGSVDATSSQPVKPAGPIPFDAHTRALENRETKVTERLQAEWDAKHGWAKDLNREEVQTLVAFRKALAADPVGTLQAELAALADHPTYGPQLRSMAARQLAAGRGQAQEPAAELTPIPIQLEDGRVINVLPSEQLAIFRQQVLAEARAEMAPALQSAKDLAAAREHYENVQKSNAWASGLGPELVGLPQFKENVAEIMAALDKTQIVGDHPDALVAAVYRIYNRIVGPKLATAGHQARLHDVQAKTNAASIGNPSQTSVNAPTPMKDLSWEDALKREFARANG